MGAAELRRAMEDMRVAAHRLTARPVERIWGCSALPPPFSSRGSGGAPVGEVWFEDESGRRPDLLVKYLFTSERLSIQVHPGDAAARALGHAFGKDEAWLVLDAAPGAVIGLGLRAPLSKAALRAAALDGSLEALVDWRPVQAGDFLTSPAGTIHAIGGGLVLIEIQQNLDLTYRLYDYGRDRALHLDQAVDAADPEPARADPGSRPISEGRVALSEGGAFVIERWNGPRTCRLEAGADTPVTLVTVSGSGAIGDLSLQPGTAFLVDGPATLALEQDAIVLAAYTGAATRPELLS